MPGVLRHHARPRGVPAPVPVVPPEGPAEHALTELDPLAVDAVVPSDEAVVGRADRQDGPAGVEVPVDVGQLVVRQGEQAGVEDHRVGALEVLEPGDVVDDLLVLPLDLRGRVHAALLVLGEEHRGVHPVALREHLREHRRALLAAVFLVAHHEHHVGGVLPGVLRGVGEPARVLGDRMAPGGGDLIHRVVGVPVEQRLAGGGAQGREVELVDVALLQGVEHHAGREPIARDRDGADLGHGAVHLGAPVGAVVDVRERPHDPVLRPGGGLGVHREREAHVEALRVDGDALDLEGRDPGPLEPLEGEGLEAPHRPAPVRPPGDELALGAEVHVEQPCGEPLAEGVAGPLPDAVHLLRRRPQDDREAEVPEEHLVLEGAEAPARVVHGEAHDRAAHADVREDDRVRRQLRHPLLLGEDARA